MMLEFWQRERPTKNRQEFQSFISEFKIIYVAPITINESNRWHLMLVTQNGYRIYIQFEEKEVERPNLEEYKIEGSSSDFLIRLRFTNKWHIAEIMHFPD